MSVFPTVCLLPLSLPESRTSVLRSTHAQTLTHSSSDTVCSGCLYRGSLQKVGKLFKSWLGSIRAFCHADYCRQIKGDVAHKKTYSTIIKKSLTPQLIGTPYICYISLKDICWQRRKYTIYLDRYFPKGWHMTHPLWVTHSLHVCVVEELNRHCQKWMFKKFSLCFGILNTYTRS